MPLRAALPIVFFLCLSGCSKSPAPTTPAPGGEERITGSERIGWDQQAADATELGSFRYAIYVDGTRSELSGVTCAAAQGGFACAARLPAVTAGTHTLELASFVLDGSTVLESSKSAALRVVVGSTTAVAGGTLDATSDGMRLRREIVAEGLVDPTDLAFLPDGRILVAERGGHVRVVTVGRVLWTRRDDPLTRRDQPALTLEDVDTRGDGGLLALAAAPDFDRTGHVYAIYTATGRAGDLVFRLARFREAGGMLAERAVLLDDIPAAPVRPAASLRFGLDGQLYAALDDAGDERAGGDRASYSGKVLRLNRDGTTPSDQATPIVAAGLRSPRGLDWQSATGSLWLADAGANGVERLVVADRAYPLRDGSGAVSMAFYRGALMPGFREDLLVAPGDAPHLLRVRVDRASRVLDVRERLVLADQGAVRVVAVSPAGEIYFSTETALGRLMPQ